MEYGNVYIGIKAKEEIFIFNEYYDEIPRHRKKKKKKRVKKSDHKHEYMKVLIKRKEDGRFRYCYGEVCKICGRIKTERIFETKRIKGQNCYRILSQDEILEKYGNLRIIEKSSDI